MTVRHEMVEWRATSAKSEIRVTRESCSCLPRASRLSRSSRITRISCATVSSAGGAQKGLEQSPVEGMPVEEKFRVPLDTEKEAVDRRLNRLHDIIGSRCADDQ
jgi:hypothetical protein